MTNYGHVTLAVKLSAVPKIRRGGIEMKVMDMTDKDLAMVEARVSLETMEWKERKSLARESKNAALLAVLSDPNSSEYDDPDIIEHLLNNSATPPVALKNIASRKVREDKTTMPWSIEEDRNKIERWTIKAVRHPNADMHFASEMAKHDNWTVRYAVALTLNTERRGGLKILEKLSKDDNVAVAAMASKQMGIEEVDEQIDVGVKCEEINRAYEKVKRGINSGMAMVRTVGGKISADDTIAADKFYEASGHIAETLESLKKKLANDYAALVRHRFLPNADLNQLRYLDAMAKFGTLHFDAYIVASMLKEMIAKRSEVSLEQFRAKAQRMLPYLYRSSNGSNDWGPANRPEHIQRGRCLQLHFYVTTYEHSDQAHIESKHMDELVSFDRLSQVALTGADPALVDMSIAHLFQYSIPRKEMYRKKRLSPTLCDLTSITSLRVYANGKIVIEYKTEAEAHKVAEFLVGATTQPQPTVNS
jgi:hypothetical protein